jgi:hypothetical protein
LSFIEKVKDVLANVGFPVGNNDPITIPLPGQQLKRPESLYKVAAPEPWPAPPAAPKEWFEQSPFSGEPAVKTIVVDMTAAETKLWMQELQSQLEAFEAAPLSPPVDANKDYIQNGFEKFHADNPAVYEKLVELALAAKANGHTSLGIGLLWERLRYYYTIEVTGGRPKFNNNYRSRYARLIMQQEPALAGFFRTRELY